eukprot:TRINITY_DN694_c0_g1_i7.p1 TRINITY_DN694_c0_g1~~TRINITY_DN694_c0_g1_i7.p1  ORF type:complete len:131 (+),score=12.46 TRINITY_DN694_c0_g1_i7:304-696(+)
MTSPRSITWRTPPTSLLHWIRLGVTRLEILCFLSGSPQLFGSLTSSGSKATPPDSRSFGAPISRRRNLPPRTSPCPSLDDLSTVDHLENTPHLSTPLDKAWSHAARDPMFFRIPAAIRILDVLRIQGNSP